MSRLKGYERKIVEYFNKKKYYNNSFLKYSIWHNRIKYLLGDELPKYDIRKLFVSLIEQNYFITKKIKKRSYLYQFVNKKKQNKNDELFEGVIIVFD
tara:strand:- start:323 stop:613 length:291 start_codon:yes stop_codon:yes gene_type:complete